jgi:hypothetical protein
MRFFVILIGVILLTTSCKKSDENSELNLSQITSKVKNLTFMQDALNTLSEVRDMNSKKINPNLTDDAKVQDYIRKINSSKSKQELVSVFNSAGIQESDELLNKLELINNNILKVYLAVPELKQLTAQDRTQIFTEILKEHQLINKLKFQSDFLAKLNLSNKIALEDFSCYHNFSRSYTSCQDTFDVALLITWVGLGEAVAGSFGIAVYPALGTALTLSAGIYLQREMCIQDADVSFKICAQSMQ